MVCTLFVISLLTFGVFQILPGNPVDVILGVDADPLQAQALEKQLGLDLPLGERYVNWIGDLFRGDLGDSIRYQVPVGDLLKSSLPVTISLTVFSLLITVVTVIPIAIFLAKNNNKKSALFLSFLTQIGVAVPSFWLGILLIMLFAVTLQVLPSGDFIPFSEDPLGCIRSLILPSVAIAIGTSAVVIRYLKNTLLDQMNLDYVRTARSKGATQKRVLYRHVLKNALLPTITILGMTVVDVLGGSIIVENVFNLPGIGHLITSGVGNRDFPLVQGLVFYLAFMVIVINLVVDLLYMAVDPRIRLE
ncbi:MAG: hypothetical protein RHS_0833 [Robinsoniella sp. RHS]|nr:MAG: hypothetical protein RHS_0833 [Robinsoniella sp. RHS]